MTAVIDARVIEESVEDNRSRWQKVLDAKKSAQVSIKEGLSGAIGWTSRQARRHWLISYMVMLFTLVVAVYFFGVIVVSPLIAAVMGFSPILGLLLILLWIVSMYWFGYWVGGKFIAWLSR